jgi:hypothetical protein
MRQVLKRFIFKDLRIQAPMACRLLDRKGESAGPAGSGAQKDFNVRKERQDMAIEP